MITSLNILNYASNLHNKFSEKDYISDNLEVEYRNCARMAYYSLLHLSKSLIEKENVCIDTGGITGTHAVIIAKLLAIDSDFSKKLAEDLKSCRAIRVKADYYLDKHFNKNEAYKVLRKAEKAFENLEVGLSTGTK
ncbi:HEPN domain-containing protein [Proteus faecis]|uniref:HEPN domain-containing protein n=1 Tax=Proteus faecis TaxID=2050967 RepID=UPI000D69E7B9|nr:HEPN domain-containing protein [Proteus faecis]